MKQSDLEKLRDEIRHHEYCYYVLDKPEISDAQFDKLYSQLQKFEEDYPHLITSDSPTQRVGGKALESMPSMTHKVSLLSLDSLFSKEEVIAFYDRIKKTTKDDFSVVAEPKLDGLSIELVYQNGIFIQAGTRGDGVIGEDVTHNIKTIKSLPLKLRAKNPPQFLHLRGEVLIKLSSFKKINQQLMDQSKETFANPRNAASGAVRQLDSRESKNRNLDLFVYDLLFSDDWKPQTQTEILEQLKKWGLPVNELHQECQNLESVFDYHLMLENKRDKLDYEIDGIVVKLDSLTQREMLGVKARSPKWAFAFKFKAREAITLLENIIIQVGRTGALTPVAILKPVEVGGVTVSRASLHNLDIIEKLDVRVGDEVIVARAGDVIPEIVSVNHQKRKPDFPVFQMPDCCPECGSHIIREKVHFYCTGGLYCKAQVKNSIIHYASKRAMNIEGLGQQTVDLLFENKLIKNLVDLYQLTLDDLLKLEGFKNKKAQNLIDAIQDSKNKSLSRFLFALGIRHVGEEVARLIVDTLGNLESITKSTIEDLQNIDGIGPEIAKSLNAYFRQDHNLKLIKQLLDLGMNPKTNTQTKSTQPLSGMTFVFTGELESMSRDKAQEKVRLMGAKTTNSISKNTTYLVIGDKPGSKEKKAQELGVAIIKESQLLKLIESH